MSSTNQKLESNGMQDKEILHKFIAEAQPLLSQSKSNEETLTSIYRRAAKELETYYDDHSMICARLSRVFPSDQSRLIRKSLDTKYKRGYDKAVYESEIPITEVEELFLIAKESLDDLLRVTNRILEKIRVSPSLHIKLITKGQEFLTDNEKAELAKVIQSQKLIVKSFGTMAELKKTLEMFKDWKDEIKVIQDMFDDRLKLDDYRRVYLKLYDLILHYRASGKIWHMSSKWMKQVLEDPKLERIIEQSGKCPQCDFDWNAEFNKQAKRIDRGLPVKLPPGFNIDFVKVM